MIRRRGLRRFILWTEMHPWASLVIVGLALFLLDTLARAIVRAR